MVDFVRVPAARWLKPDGHTTFFLGRDWAALRRHLPEADDLLYLCVTYIKLIDARSAEHITLVQAAMVKNGTPVQALEQFFELEDGSRVWLWEQGVNQLKRHKGRLSEERAREYFPYLRRETLQKVIKNRKKICT